MTVVLNTVFFNACANETYAADQMIVLPQHDHFASIIDLFQSAKKTIDLVMYTFNDRDLAYALVREKEHGIKVRVLLERKPYKAKNENKEVISILRRHHVPLHFSSKRYDYTHQKTWIIDDNAAYVSTGNFVPSSDCCDRNFVVRINNQAMVSEIEQVFNKDWQHQSVWMWSSSLAWSPVNSYKKMLPLLYQAKYSLEIYALELSDESIFNALKKTIKKGVLVTIITGSSDNVSHYQESEYFNELQKMGAKIYHLNSLVPHAKMILSDYAQSNAAAFVGSQNFSKNSLKYNRELGMMIDNPEILKTLHDTFQKDCRRSTFPQSQIISFSY